MPTTSRRSNAPAEAHSQSQSPSPPPLARPTTSSPGIRASALQKVYNDALSHTLRACSYQNFAACFPTPAKYAPEALDGLHRDFVGKLDELCKAEFHALMEERDVIPSLNELDNLITDAKKRMERAKEGSADTGNQMPPTPPHLLPPSAILAAHLMPFLSTQTDSLSTQLHSTQQINRQLAEDIAAQRSTMEGLVHGLEGFVQDLEAAAAALGGDEMQGVEVELREMGRVV